jgi:hypothetical protein
MVAASLLRRNPVPSSNVSLYHLHLILMLTSLRADPMTALLSPAFGGSMQSQMEAKLASMNFKSPGLKSNMPCSSSARTFNTSADSSPSFLSPDSANSVKRRRGNPRSTARHTQSRQQRRTSICTSLNHERRARYLASVSSLGQVSERDNSPSQDISIEFRPSRPQSTDFSSLCGSPAFRSPRPGGASLDALSPAMGDS